MTQTLQKISGNAAVTEPILEKFRHFESVAKTSQLPFRKAGLALFAEAGFPTLHDEDWRFTNVAPIAKLPFQLAGQVAVNGAESRLLDEAAFTKLPGHRLIFVNGFFSAKLSSIKPVAGGARIENLSAALTK